MDGLQLAQAIKADPALAPLPLLMLSSHDQRERGAAVPRDIIAAFLIKPVRQAQLYRCLQNVIGAAARLATVAPHRRPPEAAPPAGYRDVLLVEDNRTNQRVAARMFEKVGCRVDVASDGHEVMRLLAQRDYEVVFIDYQMPEMDGFAATAAMRAREAAMGQHTPCHDRECHAG